MEIEAFIKTMKDIYSILIDFIEADDDSEVEFGSVINILEEQKVLENKEKIKLLVLLISKISDNHHRTSNFYDKLEKIIRYLIKDTPSPISDFIPDYTKYNKKILFHLLDKKIIKPDEPFLNSYLQNKSDSKNFYFLYPKIKEFLEEKTQHEIEEEIIEKYKEELIKFEEKCQIGENDSYICSLIRSDSYEEFISYVNQTNLSLSTKIEQSIYETNSFLIDKEPTLIEYASFFGSIQIIQYLKYNGIQLTFSLWSYAIHSNNAELIHFLEENKIYPEKNENVLEESIKCHHNSIADYIKNNFYDQIQTKEQNKVNDQVQTEEQNKFNDQVQTEEQNNFFDDFCYTISDSLNFFFFPSEIASLISEPKNKDGFKLSKFCSSLTIISIPSSVTSIGKFAFSGCSSLTHITIPSSVTIIDNYSFCKCSKLTHITIPSSVTSIGNSAFYECKSLIEMEIPSSVTSIGHNSFNGCSSLTKVTIPSSVKSIGNFAFLGCSSLTEISFENPSSLTSIGLFVFSECTSLKQIPIQSSINFDKFPTRFKDEFEKEENFKKINKQILDIQIQLNDEYCSIKDFSNTIIFGLCGSGKTSLSYVLSGKEAKVQYMKNSRKTILELGYCKTPIKDVVIDESNKIAFIESHSIKYSIYDMDDINYIINSYYTQYLIKASKNDKIKILLTLSTDQIYSANGSFIEDLFKQFNKMFPILNRSEKEAIGLVITKGENDLNDPRFYIEMIGENPGYETQKWHHYFSKHPEQVFIMYTASSSMYGKLYDFKDKYRILEFIKRNQSIDPKLEFLLDNDIRQAFRILKIDS